VLFEVLGLFDFVLGICTRFLFSWRRLFPHWDFHVYVVIILSDRRRRNHKQRFPNRHRHSRRIFVMRKMLACALVLVLALACTGCEPPSSITSFPLAPGAPLKIGYLTSLTGSCARFSQASVRGAKRAVIAINRRGGVLGHRLRLLVRDDRGRPGVGVEQARDLVLGAEVKYLAGTCSGPVAKRVARLVANPFHMLYLPALPRSTAFPAGPSSYVFYLPPTATDRALGGGAAGRALGEGSSQVQIIVRGIEQADSTDPSAVRRALEVSSRAR
jgi:substrate-binding family protein